uniref:Uncharacterized protein n=1 Tax=Ixodes scapularis TaxID=6945 RepID=A0A4D5RW62_IXOSC
MESYVGVVLMYVNCMACHFIITVTNFLLKQYCNCTRFFSISSTFDKKKKKFWCNKTIKQIEKKASHNVIF